MHGYVKGAAEMKEMNIPVGVSDFEEIRKNGYFHDVVAIFPLLLWGLEMSMKDRKYRPAFVLTIFINCLLNYFFFVGEVVFLVIYYLIRYRKLPVRQFVSGIFTCALYSG